MTVHQRPNIIIKNRLRNIASLKIGPNCKSALILTVGVTKNYSTVSKEIKKIQDNLKYGVDMINDVTISSVAEIEKFQKELVAKIPLTIKSVPGYEVSLQQEKDKQKILTKDYFLSILEKQAKRGIDAITIHPSILREDIPAVDKATRHVKITARGGGLIYEYMKKTGEENPFYEYFDDIVALAKQYHMVISFGQAFRPGCIADRPGEALDRELKIQSALAKRAHKVGVGTMAEVLGHVRLTDFPGNMRKVKRYLKGTVLNCMGPLLIDTSIGHEHITSAIGFTLAGCEGVDMVVNVTPDEHIRIPQPKSIREGIIANRIACHIVDTQKIDDVKNDLAVGMLRKTQKECFTYAEGKRYLIDPYNENLERAIDECSMCGSFCPRIKTG